MNTGLDYELRAALDDLVDVAPPTGMAAGAIRRGVRRRRLVRAGSTLGGLAVVGLVGLALMPGVVRAPHTVTPGPGADPLLPRVVLVYGGIAGGVVGPAEDISLVLNLASGGYESLPYHTVVPSPDGSQLFVVDGDNSAAYPTRMGILDRATEDVRWLPGNHGYQGGAAWSPDGTRILLSDAPRSGPHGFTLVDVATLTPAFVELPQLNTTNALGMSLVWAPGGTEVLQVQSRSDAINGFARYTVDGTPAGAAEFTDAAAITALMSPGRTRLLIVAPGGTISLLDTATGAASSLNLVGHAPIGWADEAHVLAVAHDPTRTAPLSISVVDLSGTVVAAIAPPAGVGVFQSIVVGSSAGLTPGAAALTF
jgi:hypothetical protein